VNTNASQTGFTLVEMLVAIAVALIFVGGMLFSRGNFDSTVRLGSIAREVALIAREAQTSGAGGGGEGRPHGIFLDTASSSEVIFYAENGGSDGYDSSDELLEAFELPVRYSIDVFCVADNTSTEDCSGGSVTTLNDLSVYFVRPSLSANFQNSNGNASSSQRAIIDLIHEDSGNNRSVVIDTTGYITVP
jgi:prepilin-type N-terminal cleavage/methylation domain-containing protein